MSTQLDEGIQAAKAGDRERARHLLLSVVEADEENEQGWLWLSGVMETWEERRICLENVLTLNPDNEVAQRGLTKLKATAPRDLNSSVRQQGVTPVSAAAAILYPERHIKEQEDRFWPDEDQAHQPNAVQFIQDSSYDDAWTSGKTLCAFCANPVSPDDTRCSQCKRALIGWRHRYPQATARLVNYLVVLSGLSLFFLIDFFLDISLQYSIGLIGLHGLLTMTLISMVLAAYNRLLWGHYGAMILAFFIILINGNLLYNQIQASPFAEMDGDLNLGFLIAVSLGLKLIEALTALVVLALGAFVVAPEFDRQQMRFTAQVERNLRDASQYHIMAGIMAREGMWATAILHWEHAAAHAPNHAQYQHKLGSAYARLGFYERSLDALQSAYRLANNPEVKAEIALLIDDVKQRTTR